MAHRHGRFGHLRPWIAPWSEAGQCCWHVHMHWAFQSFPECSSLAHARSDGPFPAHYSEDTPRWARTRTAHRAWALPMHRRARTPISPAHTMPRPCALSSPNLMNWRGRCMYTQADRGELRFGLGCILVVWAPSSVLVWNRAKTAPVVSK